MKIKLTTLVEQNFITIFQQFDLKLFKALRPPLMPLNVRRFDGCKKGDEVHLELGKGPFKALWVSLITDAQENDRECFFIDEGRQLPFPLKTWHHKHLIQRIDDHKSHIIDDIDYSTGSMLMDRIVYPVLYAQFALRGPVYRKYFSKGP